MKAKLNRSFVASLPPQTKKVIIWDSELSGFGIRICPGGSKSWLVDFRVAGRRRRKVIADYALVTPEAARAQAKKFLSTVELGGDPFQESDDLRKQRTLREFSAEYMARHGDKKASARNDAGYLKNHILPKLGGKRLSEIKRPDVAEMHSSIGKAHETTANRCVSTLSKMFNMAVEWGFLPEGHSNPCHKFKRFHEESRDRFLNRDEMHQLLGLVMAHPNPYVSAAIILDLLSGLRLGELLRIKWDEVDLENKQVAVRKTKQKKPNYVPLSDAAMKLIKNIAPLKGNPYLFPGWKKGTHLTTLKKPWADIRKRAGLEDITFHDLRRTLASWLAQSGHSLALIGSILGHSNPATTQIYARFNQESQLEALNEHAKRVKSVMKKKAAKTLKPASS